MAGVSMLALAACTATPRYPINEGQPRGPGGVDVAAPRYPVDPNQPPPRPAPSPPPRSSEDAAPPPAEDEGPPPRAAPLHPIEEKTLGAPGSDSSGAPSSRPSSAYPPTPQQADLRGRQTQGLPITRAAPPPALETPRQVQVQPFENLYDIAERTRTPIRAIIDANGLRPPYALTPGTLLKIPAPAVYTVAEGDTLFAIARRFSIDARSLANFNDIPLETRVRPGQRLAMPSLVHDKGPMPAANGPRPTGLAESLASATSEAGAASGKAAAVGTAAAVKTASAARIAAPEPPPRVETPPASEADIASLGKGKFIWPVRGQILSGFGAKGPGQRNDGLNIAATEGAPVKAAAAGVVVYAGNSIPAFGNLVLVKHPGGWATLYGNLGKITVKNNAQLSQGEQVGTAGVSGAVDRPQVHFEIRYAPNPKDKAKPYDPAALLPGG
jgi:murein DD-endopeptidase MepM/ murein hydrolase activator NlpD